MPKKRVSEKERKKIFKKVRSEFPGCQILQDIHRYRYLKEIEWETMTPEEIIKDIKAGAHRIKTEMEVL